MKINNYLQAELIRRIDIQYYAYFHFDGDSLMELIMNPASEMHLRPSPNNLPSEQKLEMLF